MPLDTGNPWDDLDTPADGSQPKLDINAKDGKLYITSPANSGRGFGVTEVPIGALLCLDFGWVMTGLEQFQPKYRSHFAPLGAPQPQVPAGESWTPSTRIQAWVDGHGGLRVLRVRGQIHLRRFKTLFQLFGYRPEAQVNKIPVYEYKGFEDVPTDYGTYHGILLELRDFTDRDEDLFGPRITPPPPPILAAGARTPMLSSSTEAGEGEAPVQPVAPPEPVKPFVETPPTQPERTPFSAFRPTPVTTVTAPETAAPSPPPRKPGARKPY